MSRTRTGSTTASGCSSSADSCRDSNLAIGAHGPAVKVLQRALRAAGADLVVDGNFGAQTEKVVKAYQKEHQVRPANGVVNENTRFFLGMGGVFGELSSALDHQLQKQRGDLRVVGVDDRHQVEHVVAVPHEGQPLDLGHLAVQQRELGQVEQALAVEQGEGRADHGAVVVRRGRVLRRALNSTRPPARLIASVIASPTPATVPRS